MKVEKGKRIRLEYELRDAEGNLVESSQDKGPLEYVHGSGQIPIREMELLLEGAQVGEERSGRVPLPIDNPTRLEYPSSTFPEGTPLDPGTLLEAKRSDGSPVLLRVVEKKDDTIVVEDLPLLQFKGKVLEIADA